MLVVLFMIERMIRDIPNFVRPENPLVRQKLVQKIKTDLARTPQTDMFVINPTIKTYKQKLVELEKKLASFDDKNKDKILKNSNKENLDTLTQLTKLKYPNGRLSLSFELPGLSSKITSKNKDVILSLAKMQDPDGHFIHSWYLESLAPIIKPENEDLILKMAEITDSNGKHIHGTFDLHNNLLLHDEIKYKINNISDSKIFDYTNKNTTLNANRTTLEKANEVLDVYHTFNNNYSHVGIPLEYRWVKMPNNQDYYQYLKRKPDSLLGGKDELINPLNQSNIARDFRNESRIERLKEFCKKNPNDEMSNYFYNEYYLKSDMVSKEISEKCAQINEKFGTKIFLSQDLSSDNCTLNYIELELQEWQRASKGDAKSSGILDLGTIKRDYIDETSAIGQGPSRGFANLDTNEIAINGSSYLDVDYALRHELTHINDPKRGANIPNEYNLKEIMPKKLDEERVLVPDFENCKYKEEFYNAGISEKHTIYAYNNTAEFIAVASEGDMSKYSPEFKQMLIDFEMPEWMFEMKPKSKILNEAILRSATIKTN